MVRKRLEYKPDRESQGPIKPLLQVTDKIRNGRSRSEGKLTRQQEALPTFLRSEKGIERTELKRMSEEKCSIGSICSEESESDESKKQK